MMDNQASQNPRKETTMPRKAKKQYSSVEEMVFDITGDNELVEEIEHESQEHSIVDMLFATRSAQGLSQERLAEIMNCSQSHISKIENSLDADLKIGELQSFLSAVRSPFVICFTPKNTTVERAKALSICIQQEIALMARLAEKDEEISEGVKNQYYDLFLDLAKMMEKAIKSLPDVVSKSEPDKDSSSSGSVARGYDIHSSGQNESGDIEYGCNEIQETNGDFISA